MGQSKKNTLKVITITGTNGKGSTVAFCEAILLAAGYNVGAYYSPHVFDISERIKINGEPITLPQYRTSDNFSFAELTQQAIALFNQSNLDAVILEVGIGGRLDPVNTLANPDVSVITNISFDHQDKLGDTLDKIGLEKAHVFRSHKPAIYGDINMPKSVINYANKIQAELFSYKNNFDYEVYENSWTWKSADIQYDNLPIPYLNLHDAAIALAALNKFPLKISLESIREGLKSAYLPGRFQIIHKPVLQIFDVAHNPASAILLAKNLEKINSSGKTFGVVGMLKDKDILGTLKPLLAIVNEWFVGTVNDPRAATGESIGQYLSGAHVFDDIHEAYKRALTSAGPNDRLVVFGSFRTIGALCPDKN